MLMINSEERRLCKQLRMLYCFCSNAARMLNTADETAAGWVVSSISGTQHNRLSRKQNATLRVAHHRMPDEPSRLLLGKCMKSPHFKRAWWMDLQVDFWSKFFGTYWHHQNITPVFKAGFSTGWNFRTSALEPVGSANSSHHRRSLRCRCCSSPLFLGGVPAVKR